MTETDIAAAVVFLKARVLALGPSAVPLAVQIAGDSGWRRAAECFVLENEKRRQAGEHSTLGGLPERDKEMEEFLNETNGLENGV